MSLEKIDVLEEVATLEELSNMVAKLQRTLRYLLNGNLDFQNIRVKGIIADNIDVNELSAITANLGKILAGEIYGTYIATSESNFPRAEMSESTQMFRVMLSPISYAEFAARAGLGAGETPALRFVEGVEEFVLGHGAVLGGYMGIKTNGYFMISASDGVYINNLRVTSWADIYNASAGKTLAAELNALTSSITTLNSSVASLTAAINNKATKGVSTGSAGHHNHGIPDGTELLTPTGSVTFYASGSHSHNQN